MTTELRVLSWLALVFFFSPVFANEILPENETYESTIPTPAGELGWPVGEWYARPEQITRYFERLADSSARASLQVIGRTHEPLPLAAQSRRHPEPRTGASRFQSSCPD